MKILVTSEQEAVALSRGLSRKTAIISITAPGQERPVFAKSEFITGIFRLCFSDIASEVPGMRMPEQSDFEGLRGFLDGISSLGTQQIIVHCGAGISRSAGLAQAVSEYLGTDVHIFDNPAYIPNRLVWYLAGKELGLSRTKKEYENLFRDQTSAAGANRPQSLKDPRKTVEIIMRALERNQSVSKAAAKAGISEELAEKIMRLIVTHPGVGTDGIMDRMGL